MAIETTLLTDINLSLTDITKYLTLVFSAVGVVIVSIGGFTTAGKLGYRALKKLPMDYFDLKRKFTQLIVLGLDFFIAGDILTSFVAPSFNDLILLAMVVGIRTVLSVFLVWEVRTPSKEDS
ncbi:MAG: DUF1622 domain-containing protein [Methanomassiliicoccales archaeon]|jgi:uncharacterized membrane protein